MGLWDDIKAFVVKEVVPFVGDTIEEYAVVKAREWAKDNLHQYLITIETSAVSVIVETNVSVWDEILSDEQKEWLVKEAQPYKRLILSMPDPVGFALELLEETAPEYAKVITRGYLQSQFNQIVQYL